MILESLIFMNAGDGITTGRRILTSQPDDGSARCRSSRVPGQPSDSCPSTRPPTTRSTSAPSHLSKNAPSLPNVGNADVARCHPPRLEPSGVNSFAASAIPQRDNALMSDQWEEGFSYLRRFLRSLGHCRVARSYKADDGYRLGSWVSHQRNNREKIGTDRRQRLEALPGWSWDMLSDRWEKASPISNSSRTGTDIAELLEATRPMTVIGWVLG